MFQRTGHPITASKSGDVGSGTLSQQESDRAFLERNGVPQMMRGLLNKLVETRPSDPLAAMADYFQTQFHETNRKSRRINIYLGNFASIDVPSASVALAHRHLQSAAWHSPAFLFHLNAAYETLSEVNQGKGSGSGKSKLKAVNGELVNELIHNCLKDVSKNDMFEKQMKMKPYWLIPFDVFRYIMTSTLIFKDFVSLATSLYKDLVPDEVDKDDRARCKSVLRLLEDNLAVRDKTSPKNVLNATKNMSAPEVDKLLMQKPSSQVVAPSMDEFVEAAVCRFLDGLPNVN